MLQAQSSGRAAPSFEVLQLTFPVVVCKFSILSQTLHVAGLLCPGPRTPANASWPRIVAPASFFASLRSRSSCSSTSPSRSGAWNCEPSPASDSCSGPKVSCAAYQCDGTGGCEFVNQPAGTLCDEIGFSQIQIRVAGPLTGICGSKRHRHNLYIPKDTRQ